MLVADHLPGRTIRTEDGRERLYFSGTSYLGIGHSEAFQELLQEGMSRYGTIYSSSRSSNVQLAVYEVAESLLAELTGAEAALTFSSGYQAGQAVIRQFDTQPNILYAPNTHPAIWRTKADATPAVPGRDESSPGSFADWADTIVKRVNDADGDCVIVANSVDPLFARPHHFAWISQLPDNHRTTLLVDDSHGLGVTGEAGGGIFATLQSYAKPNVTVVVVSSLGKAFGLPGGVVLGPRLFIKALRSSPFFVAGSPPPPAYLLAFTRAQAQYEAARQQLFANVAYFRKQTEDLAIFRSIDHYPVFYTADHRLAEALAPRCVLSSFPYPHPDSNLITRAIISSLHTREDLDALEGLVRSYERSK